ncbi:MAG: DUF488 family protein [Candidatus Brocadiia bacterium]
MPQPPQPPAIWTVGHSTRSRQALAELLAAHGIRCLIDVRRFPRSRKNPQFDRPELGAALPRAGIRYLWMGEELGGFRKGGYRAYMGTGAFAAALSRLEALASQAPTAVMCAEKLFFRCHRRFIADVLARRGWRVVHIIEPDRWQVHRLRPEDPELPFDRPPQERR